MPFWLSITSWSNHWLLQWHGSHVSHSFCTLILFRLKDNCLRRLEWVFSHVHAWAIHDIARIWASVEWREISVDNKSRAKHHTWKCSIKRWKLEIKRAGFICYYQSFCMHNSENTLYFDVTTAWLDNVLSYCWE